MDEQGNSMKVGDLVKLKPTTTWARCLSLTAGAAIVTVVNPGGVRILTKNQKQIWVSLNEIEVLSESR